MSTATLTKPAPRPVIIGNGSPHQVAVEFRFGARWKAECLKPGCGWHRLHHAQRMDAYDAAESHVDQYAGQYGNTTKNDTGATP